MERINSRPAPPTLPAPGAPRNGTYPCRNQGVVRPKEAARHRLRWLGKRWTCIGPSHLLVPARLLARRRAAANAGRGYLGGQIHSRGGELMLLAFGEPS